jgi:hypothetical protein
MKNVETSIISNPRHILNMRLDLLPCDSSGSTHIMGHITLAHGQDGL